MNEPGESAEEVVDMTKLQGDIKLELEKATAEIQKLKLEIKALEWENSLLGRVLRLAGLLTIIATVVTIIATGVGVGVGFMKFVDDRQKDRDLRGKELTERTTNQYRSDLEQLIGYPVNPKQTVSSASFLFQDLHDLVEKGFDEGQRDQYRIQIGSLLAQIVRSDDYDLSVMRNLEFDRKAMFYCDYYKRFLKEHPGQNGTILSKYSFVLASMHDENPKYYQAITSEPNFLFSAPKKGHGKFGPFVHLFQGYQEHLNLFDEAIHQDGSKNSEIQDSKRQAACWFYASTKNDQLTETLLGIDKAGLKEFLDHQCEDMK